MSGRGYRSALLTEAWRRLARQSPPVDEFEVIVADDGSSDDTPAVVAALGCAVRTRVSRPRSAPPGTILAV